MHLRKAGLLTFIAAVLLPVMASAMSNDPKKWINRMHVAVSNMNYQGTLVHMSGGDMPRTETFRIYHRSVQGETIERLVGMDGDGYESIRNSEETVCIFPASKTVVIQKRETGPKSPLTSGLPPYSEEMDGNYSFEIVGDERVAGRAAKVLKIAPQDAYRYGYKIWIDVQTGMPLKSQLCSADGTQLLEEVMFADIALQQEVAADLVMSSYDTSGYEEMMPEQAVVVERDAADIGWKAGQLPPGFALGAVRQETMVGASDPRLHMIYKDGLASVSVFVDMPDPDHMAGLDAMGATHAFTVISGDYVITAVGQVPAETVKIIAESMQAK